MTDTRFDRAVWYHDFSALGLPTKHRGEFYRSNQEAKAPMICHLIDEALRIVEEHPTRANRNPTAMELFCADAYYAMYVAKIRPFFQVHAMDRSADEIKRGRAVAKALDLQDRVMLEQHSVGAYHGDADLVLCTGGLYHLHDPLKLLKRLCQPSVKAMVVQSVYSLEDDHLDYFGKAPPDRPHGSRFSAAWLLNAIRKAGWDVVEDGVNELKANPMRDRGSLYVLCKPKEQHSKRTAQRSGASSHS